MRTINEIIIHCSASHWGNAAEIDKWHKARGWDGIGYHYVIGNAYPTAENYKDGQPEFSLDGNLETGRVLGRIGAHCRGHNKHSVGICLIGKRTFTRAQFATLSSLVKLIKSTRPGLSVWGHYEFFNGKTCPNINIDHLNMQLDGESVL